MNVFQTDLFAKIQYAKIHTVHLNVFAKTDIKCTTILVMVYLLNSYSFGQFPFFIF